MEESSSQRVSPVVLVAMAAGFALAHTQSPLFFSNQNQYLLHGLAEAGYGHLAHDWLATTQDPTPVFSFLVKWLYKLGGLFALQAAYFVLLMYYFAASWRLVSALGSPPLVPFAALFTAAHAAIFRVLSVQLDGVDYPWYFQAGLAGQYLLGPGLQPSAFGVLLIGSLASFARGRPVLAAFLAALAADIHATYLLPAALLVIGYVAQLLREKRSQKAAISALLALAAVSPILIYIESDLRNASPEANQRAEYVLAHVRIPHHTQIARWLDLIAGLQIAWIVMGIALIWQAERRQPPGDSPNVSGEGPDPSAHAARLALPLLVAFLVALALSLIQAANHSDALALLFPWRISVLLVPVATTVVVMKLAEHDRSSRAVAAVSFVLFIVQAVGGLLVMVLGIGYQMNQFELPMLQHVRETASAEDVYLIPTKLPAPSSKRGIESFTFTPAPQTSAKGIPVDLQRFRLATGAAIYIDFKSMPYAANEVIEWQRRMHQVETWYEEKDWDRLRIRDELKNEGITKIVVPRTQALIAEFLEQEYADNAYAVYRVK